MKFQHGELLQYSLLMVEAKIFNMEQTNGQCAGTLPGHFS